MRGLISFGIVCLTWLATLTLTVAAPAPDLSSSEERQPNETTEEPNVANQKIRRSSRVGNVVLILYKNGLGLVKDIRSATLLGGDNRLEIYDVPRKFVESSLLLRALQGDHVVFGEASFRSELLTLETLLRLSIGEKVWVRHKNSVTGAEMKRSGELLSVDDHKATLKGTDGMIETVPAEMINFTKIPASLSIRPFLSLRVRTPIPQKALLDLTYLTRGISWTVDYTVEIIPNTSRARMMGWVVIKNTSGVDFRKAQISLVASDISRKEIRAPQYDAPFTYPMTAFISLYHNALKRVAFLSASDLEAHRHFRIELPGAPDQDQKRSETSLRTQVWFSIANTSKNRLGLLLPPGNVEVYASDTQNRTRYIGRIKTQHTNLNATLDVPLDTCDLIDAQCQQTDFRQIGDRVVESTYRVDLTNKNTMNIEVFIAQHVPLATTMLRSSHPHLLKDDTLTWKILIPKGQTVSLRYRLHITASEKDSDKLDGDTPDKPSPEGLYLTSSLKETP